MPGVRVAKAVPRASALAAIEGGAPAARQIGRASSCELVQGPGVRLHVGVSGQCPLGGEPQDDGLEQLRYPLRVGAGAERPGRLPPPDLAPASSSRCLR